MTATPPAAVLACVPLVLAASAGCAARTAAPATGLVRANGIELYYEASGSGAPLVLIEGLGVATWSWERQVPEFARHFRTIVYDNRGAGLSSKPAGPYTIGQMADDLAGLLDGLGIERAHVVGASMGGMVAQEFALRYPARVDRLVLVATTAGGATHVPMTPETLARFFAPAAPGREGIRDRLRLAVSDSFLATSYAERMIDVRLAEPQPSHAFHAQAAAGATFDRSATVSQIVAPTLIAAGTADVIVPVANARFLAERIPDSRLVMYEGLGHQFFVEAPDRFNRDVIDFLQQRR
ncbi:alpha/beta fold hydrolase [soil metagenome]